MAINLDAVKVNSAQLMAEACSMTGNFPGWDSMVSKAESEMVSHIIDIKELEDLNTFEYNIYKVPCTVWKPNNEAFTPQLISIGPLHFNQQKLNPMQKKKLQYFHLFWVRVKNDEAMNNFKSFLEGKEEAIRHCYEVKLSDICKQQFVEMMLLDAVFIMELMLRNQENSLSDNERIQENKSNYEDDSILKQTWLNKGIKRDLLLLENQIPFFILEELYKVVPDTNKKQYPRFIELATKYFDCFYPHTRNPSARFNAKDHFNCFRSCKSDSSSWLKLLKDPEKKPFHFTDLIRYFYLCEDLSHPKKQASCNVLRTATKLQQAGVTFEKKKNRSLLDIKFKKLPILSWFLCLGCIPKFTCFKARLQIPQLKVDDATECVLRNLIAFEQCHYANKPYICNYVSLIDSLIHTKDDVELLVEKEVIVHELGSDKEVATLVNGLCKHVVTDVTCYKEIIDELNEHYQRQWNRTMAALWLVYFRDTWRTSSTVVGIAILVFAIFNFWRIVQLIFKHKPLKF